MNFISNLSNNIIAHGKIYFNLAKNKISNMTLQHRVAAVALAVLSSLILIYLVHRSHHFKASSSFQEKAKSISERLEANRKDAVEQQMKELPKGFEVKPGTAPEEVNLTASMKMPIHGEEKLVNERFIGMASCQGRRGTMEDADLADLQSFTVRGKSYPFEIFGVFDGHGGTTASAFVKQNITQYLKKALEENNQKALTEPGIFKALKECFIKLDADYKGSSEGTTATVAIVLNGKIWVANVGDARTILVDKEGKIIQASEDAKPSMEKYKQSIEKLGGFITYSQGGPARVNGVLAVARAIGDNDEYMLGKEGKYCISPNPKITDYLLKNFEGGHLVLACDGLYDVATTNEVGKAIIEMANRGESSKSMSQKLVYHAITGSPRDRKSCSGDNVSTIVVKL